MDVKLEELQQVNADIIGWIRFDNLEQLSYPVLYSGDDEKYLRTDIYGNQTIAGCIFYGGDEHTGFSGLPYNPIWAQHEKLKHVWQPEKNIKQRIFIKIISFYDLYIRVCVPLSDFCLL